MTHAMQRTSIRPAAQAVVPNVFQRLRQEMDELFDNVTGNLEPLSVFHHGPSLKADVVETDDALTVKAEMPGMDAKDVEITFDGELLTIKGEKQEEHEEKKKDYHFRERSWGSFERTIAVPFVADPEKVSASFSKGVLTLIVPKPPGAKKSVKKIAVKAKE
jgi:HSP20 family protein